MTTPATSIGTEALPYAGPSCENARIMLYAVRRLGAAGLGDAQAAHALFSTFGSRFRRPLTMVRVMMAEVAATAALPIAIAPCCCGRMTTAERALLSVIARVETRPETARLLLADLLGVRRVEGVLATAAAVAAAFADEGRPIAV